MTVFSPSSVEAKRKNEQKSLYYFDPGYQTKIIKKMGNGKTNKNYCVSLIPVIKQKSLKKMGNGKTNKNYCVSLIPVIKQKSLKKWEMGK